MTKLVIEVKNLVSDNVAKYIICYCNSKAETIINESDIDDVFEPIYTTIISNIKNILGKVQVSRFLIH